MNAEYRMLKYFAAFNHKLLPYELWLSSGNNGYSGFNSAKPPVVFNVKQQTSNRLSFFREECRINGKLKTDNSSY